MCLEWDLVDRPQLSARIGNVRRRANLEMREERAFGQSPGIDGIERARAREFAALVTTGQDRIVERTPCLPIGICGDRKTIWNFDDCNDPGLGTDGGGIIFL